MDDAAHEAADRAAGLARELDFWRQELSGRGSFHRFIQRRLDPETRRSECVAYVAELVAIEQQRFPGKAPRVLDVGSGPLSTVAWIAEEGLGEVDAIDPLGAEYAALLEELGIDFPIVPRPGCGEKLHELFEPDTFHLVYSRNALDHAADPQRCLDEIWRVLVPGGALSLEIFAHEGARQGYDGLHQFDFLCRGGRFGCEDRHGDPHLVIDEARFALELLEPQDTGPWDPDEPITAIHVCLVKR
jgi:SAM-dependent methyltransferase